MDGIELIAFDIISNVGMAKSLAIEALRDVREGKYDEAEKKMNEASECLVKGHHAHTSLIQKEAAGETKEGGRTENPYPPSDRNRCGGGVGAGKMY